MLSKNPVDFSDKEMAACCAHNFEPMAQNSTTSRLGGFFPHANIAVKNDRIFRLRAQTLRDFLTN